MRRYGFILALATAALMCGCGEEVLRIETTPSGAAVYWNNSVLGESPCYLRVSAPQGGFPEMHVVEVRHKGYQPEYHYFQTPSGGLPGMAKTVRLTLKPLPEGMSDADIGPVRLFESKKAKAGRCFNIEALLIQLKGRKVLAHASVYASRSNAAMAAENLANQVKEAMIQLPAGDVAMGPIRNRRESSVGQSMSMNLQPLLHQELLYASPLGVPTQINMRNFVDEAFLDNPVSLNEERLFEILEKYDYIVLTGLAEALETDEKIAPADSAETLDSPE